MSCRHAKINLSSRYAGSDQSVGAVVLTAQDVRLAMGPGRFFSSIRVFDSVDVLVDDRRALLSVKPLMAARLLSRGSCRVIDDEGAQSVRWRDVIGMIGATFRDLLSFPRLRRRVDARLAQLSVARPRPCIGEGPPLYLRADLWYGVKAGGSLGHIAGVLKGLRAAGWPAKLATTARIATIPDDTELLLLRPRPRHFTQSEWQQLTFNLDLVEDLWRQWLHPPPRFIYQRHGLNLFAGLDLARRWAVPFILEFNGPEVWVAEHWGRPLAEPDRARLCEEVSLAGADRIIVVSTVLADMLRARGIEQEKIRVIPNGVDTQMFTPERDGAGFRARWNLDGKIVIGFIGTFGPWHGVENLVAAFVALLQARPDLHVHVRLLLVGDGAHMVAVRDLVAEHSLEPFVVFTGLLAQAEGPDAIAAFDIAVAPTVDNADGSSFFGSPTKLFEYLAAGKATLCTAVAHVRDIIRDGENGLLVPPGDTQAMTDALERLIDDPALRSTLGCQARDDAVALHDYRIRIRQLVEAVESIRQTQDMTAER